MTLDFRYIVTTFLTGVKEPILTYANASWYDGIGILRPGIYLAEGMTMLVKENPDYGVA